MANALDSRAERGARSTRFQAPSGEIVTLDARGFDLSEPWFCWAELVTRADAATRGAPRQRGFQIGPRASVDTAIAKVLKGTVRERVALGGGELVIADGRKGSESFAAWTGPWHAAYGWFGDNLKSTTAIVAHFSDVRFVDGPLGLRLSSRGDELGRTMVTKRVAGIGLVQIMEGSAASGLVPAWSGAKVQAGELWKREVHAPGGGHAPLYLLASRTAVATLTPDDSFPTFDDGPSPAAANRGRSAVEFLESVTELAWRAGGVR
ncbi:MAG TPA: hypothetical protein VHJ34_07460 [Actinomycetota bacterium]|nr:hypothetical protein [Actinomycetota bacterium]